MQPGESAAPEERKATSGSSAVTADQRFTRNGHEGCVVWLTGLPAAGKTTIAAALERILFDRGKQVVRLDGDALRRGLSADLGFSLADRSEHARRVAAVASLFAEAGIICIVALVSPLRADRERARKTVAPRRFIEVHVATPLAVCRQRDTAGLYLRAERGEIPEFTGVSSPYESPLACEIVLHPETASVSGCVEEILRAL